jgi:DNA-binding CsgD family transcriptional regulator
MRAMTNLAWDATRYFRHAEAERRLATAIAYAVDHDLDSYHWYVVATQAMALANKGAWDEAETDARRLLDQPGATPLARALGLTALGQVATRRGDPTAMAVLDEALALAERTGQLLRLGPVRAARAEAALLRGDQAAARAELDAVRDLIVTRGNRWQRGQYAWLLSQAGEQAVPPAGDLAPPYALQLAGDFAGAGAAWQALGCPYEAAAALTLSDEAVLVREAVATFEGLGARPALAHAIRRLRDLGVHDVPMVRRGPQAATRSNPAGLTRREAEVLALLAEGLRNAEIAERLYLTPKTVSHHLASIYAKLGVASRLEAAQAAAELGIATP